MKKILILNDLHTGTSRESSTHPGIIRQANTQALATFEKYLDTFNAAHYDLVINNGDIIRDQNNQSVDMELLNSALTSFAKITSRKIYLPGNHEYKTLTQADIREAMSAAGISNELRGILTLDGQDILWLDSEIGRKDIARISDDTLSWLHDVLTANSTPIIFSHYSLLPLDGEDNFYFDGGSQYMSYANSIDVLAILAKCRSVLAINAHTHMGTYKQVGNVTSLSTLAFSENITAPQYPDANPGVYSVLTLSDDGRKSLKTYSGDYCFLSVEI